MKAKINRIFLIIIPVILFGILAFFLINTYDYNNTPRYGSLTSENFKEGVYDFGDIAVELTTRGGDAGSWLKDPIYDDDGNMLHGAYVGTIYEAVIYNNSVDTVSDWKIKLPINELMWLNNNWNSKMEVH